MNLSYFKEFTVLAETKNFWEASERLYLNQSTLSKHIRSMEQELGVELFKRTTRRVELTNYGEALLPYAETIARTEFEYSALLIQMQNYEKGLLTLGTIPSMAQYNITNILLAFQEKYPDSVVKVTEDDANNLIALLHNKKCELVFARETKLAFEQNFLTDNKIVRIPYIQDYMIALLPASHPLADRTEITLRELKDEKFCMIKENSMMYNLCVNACHAANFIPQIAFTSHRLESLSDMVANGSYVALLMNQHVLPPEQAQYSLDCPWVPVRITPTISTQISLCYLKDIPLSKTAQNFVNFFQQLYM